MRRRSTNTQLFLAAVAALPALSAASAARAATDVFTGGAGALSGTLVFPYPNATSTSTSGTTVSYYLLDTTSANFTTTNAGGLYVAGDSVLFNTSTGGLLAPQSNFSSTTAPSLLEFNGGTSSTVWTFLRASTSSTSSISAGFTIATDSPTEYPVGGPIYPTGASAASVDGFAASSPFGTTQTNVLLDSSFSGTVIFRSRPGGTPTGTTEIDGGTLELDDSEALPGKTAPTITLGGGTLSFNINTGRFNSGDGNSNPGSTDLGVSATVTPSLNVTQNSTVANNEVDDNGNNHFLSNAWGGIINITAGKTLTFATGTQYTTIFPQGSLQNTAGGLVTSGSGYGTISLGTSPGVLRFGVGGRGTNAGVTTYQPVGSTTVDFDAGSSTGGFLDSSPFSGTTVNTFNLGGLRGGSGTYLIGSNQAGQNASGLDNYSVGALNLTETFAGKITNGVGPSTRIVSLTKVGTGTQTVGANYFSGPVTVGDGTAANAGTLRAGDPRSLTDSNSAVTVTSGATLDLNGNSPNAGKAITLSGGSLVNNGTAMVTLGTGASASLTAGTTAGGTYTAAGTANSSAPSVTISGGGGSGATAAALLHVDSVGAPSGLGNYLVAPVVTISAPTGDVPGGRTAQITPNINPKTTGTPSAGGIGSFTLADTGFGYESTPTITVSGGILVGGTTGPTATVNATVTMSVDSVLLTSAGTGYTSATSLSFGLPSGSNTTAATPAVGTAGFAAVTLTANSNVGGSGPLTINPTISGAFALTKIGTGTTTLGGASNGYSGGTNVSAGVLATDVNGILGTANVSVGSTTTGAGLVLGNAGSIADGATVSFSDLSKINLNASGGSEAITALFDLSTSTTLSTPNTYTVTQLNTFFGNGNAGYNVFGASSGETITIGSVAAPEPASLLLAGGAAAPLALGRRRRSAATVRR